MTKSIGLVVPCFNESSRFPFSMWKQLIDSIDGCIFLFVDDGSKDSTEKILRKLERESNIKVLVLDSNLGKGNAIRTGFIHLQEIAPELGALGYVDSDGAFSAEDLTRILESSREALCKADSGFLDAIISSRVVLAGRNITRKLSRHYLGRIIATVLTSKWENAPYDTQCGFKIFRKSEHFLKAIQEPFRTRWFVDIELMMRIGRNKPDKLQLWEEPLNEWREVPGSKLHLSSFIRVMYEIQIARREIGAYEFEKRNFNGPN
jgi:glycosyltransferase involved in cell wall biosynthesis